MTHRDGFPRISARRVGCGDAGHREARATPSESLGKPPVRSRARPVGGRRKALTMHHIVCDFPPTRRAAHAISMGHHHRDLVLGMFVFAQPRHQFDEIAGHVTVVKLVAQDAIPAVLAGAGRAG